MPELKKKNELFGVSDYFLKQGVEDRNISQVSGSIISIFLISFPKHSLNVNLEVQD